jgi:hypothetical protein
MRALVIGLLAGWIMLAPDPHGTFSTAAACQTEVAAWTARAREGARWVTAQQQEALQQQNRAIITFWGQAVRRATRQVEAASGARCVEVKP